MHLHELRGNGVLLLLIQGPELVHLVVEGFRLDLQFMFQLFLI